MKLDPFSVRVEYHVAAGRLPKENPGELNDSVREQALKDAIDHIPQVRFEH
ncbi:MAG: hypothetical protein HPY71_01790 [Firmicutes bacterium]|nr:hypothetical protein [Bacillota bacterium]